jgi:hypothetical protein
MVRFHRPLRACAAAFAGAILLLQGLLVPSLEADGSTRRAVLESEHSDATCVVGHDHTICLQVGANRAVATPGIRLHHTVLALTSALHDSPVTVPTHAVELAHQPRGPPTA